LDCDEKLFKQVVKLSFNQRRKTIRNSIKSMLKPGHEDHPYLQLRPERLSVEMFVALTQWVQNQQS
jgi:16S rRNA (adenine1518-N6/adenine1519-N6)-dimethyltransferase